MALNPSTSSPTNAPRSAASALSVSRTSSRTRIGPDDQDDGGFAAQLLRAQPAQDDHAKPAEADATKSDASKTSSKDGDKDVKEAKDTPPSQDPKDAKAPDAPVAVDPNAVLPWMPQAAPATTALAVKPEGVPDGTELTGDPLGALRKGGASAKSGKESAIAGLGAGKDAKAADVAAPAGKGARAAGDFTAALGKAEGGGNSATGTRDSMAALLPEPDPVAVQAGAVGAPPNALLDTHATASAQPTPQAQATLPMPPQSPAFVPALGQQIEVWMKNGIQHAEVQLNPQDLGPIRVKIEMAGAQARVEMSADVQSTRDVLQQALPQLSDSLGQVGLSLSGGGVSDQSTAQSQAQAQAQANAGNGFGGSGGRSGSGGSRADAGALGGEDVALASAARQAAQRRGLLDLYA